MNGSMSALPMAVLVGVTAALVLLTLTALGIWFERKFSAKMQSRMGPVYVGPIGLLQPIADVVKLFQKEDIIPADADRALFNLAPPLTIITALGAAVVVPFVPHLPSADLDVGVIFLLAIGGLTVFPVFAAGWASNNKFALLGGMRAIAQSVSYEVPLVLGSMVPCVLAGSMSVNDIVNWQATHHWVAFGLSLHSLVGIPAFLLFFLAALAESNRIPFDIPEAESELVAGVTTEYTGIKFALFYVGEYLHTLVASAVGAALFLGGWDGPGAAASPVLGVLWMTVKTLGLFTLVYWVRWSLLRFRSDQLMKMCWTVLTPLAVALVLLASFFAVWGSN